MRIHRAHPSIRGNLLFCHGCRPSRAIMAAILSFCFAIAAPAYDIHFDYAVFGESFGKKHFDVLNYASLNGKYLMLTTGRHRKAMVSKGNDVALFYNSLQQRYDVHETKDGNLSADEIDTYVSRDSAPNGSKPKLLILNEISSSLWAADPGPPTKSTYRTWLIQCITRLHDHYGYDVVALSPYQNPRSNDASWQAISQVAYIGIECYLSGTEVWNSGTTNEQRLAWAQSQYQASKNAYIRHGVPAPKLFVVEHFANNTAKHTDPNGKSMPARWGRAGLESAANWDTVIQLRQDAIFNVGFAGFLAYNWRGNGMGISEAEQIQHEYYYRSRRVLASQKPQWLSDAPISIDNKTIPLSWGQPLNWLGSVPNSSGAEANFWRTITAKRTITLDGQRTLGTITFDARYRYIIERGSGGMLVFDNPGSAAKLNSGLGYHIINADVQLVSSLSADIKRNTFTINGVVSGARDFTKKGGGTLVLTGANTYTGDTTVEAGTLSLSTACLADKADVHLSNGATLELKFSGDADVVGSLKIDSAQQPAGTWGAVGSGAQFTSPLLKGSGRLQVTTFGG